MNNPVLLATCMLLCAGPACADDAALLPDASRGSVAVSLRAWSPLGANRLQAAEAAFVRFEEGGDAYSAPSVIRTNLEGKDGRVYLLNVDPGRYAVVAFRTRGGSMIAIRDKQWIFLEKPLIDATTVTVGPGEIAFAGEYVTGGTPWTKNAENRDEDDLKAADSAQVHYLALLFPEAEQKSTFARIYGSDPVYLGNYLPGKSPGTTAEAQSAFWKAARKDKDLDPAWDAIIGPSN